MKDKIQILLIIFAISGNILKPEYPAYNATINGTPYPSNLFVHSMASYNPHIGILNPDLSALLSRTSITSVQSRFFSIISSSLVIENFVVMKSFTFG